MFIKLNTIDDVKEFVNICSKYIEGNIDVKQGRYIVSGQSILGILSLNLMEELHILFNDCAENTMNDFYNKIRRWEV